MSHHKEIGSTTFSPLLKIDDKFLTFWLQNVTIRLRREMCWKLQERSLLLDPDTHSLHGSTAFLEKGISDLSQVRYWQNKQRFFQTDVTAKYLSDLLEQKLPEVADHDNENNLQGSMHWLADQLDLDDASILLLSLALACHLDAAVGNVVSLCLSDPSKTEATLGLAQKLWDKPEEILLLSDPGHTLFRFGLLENPMINNINNSGGVSNAFDISLRVPPLVANHLIFSRHSQLPPGTKANNTSARSRSDRKKQIRYGLCRI